MPDKRFETTDPVRLQVRFAAGDVQVTTVDGDEATIAFEGSPQRVVDATRVALVGDRLVVEQRRKSTIGSFGRPAGPLHVQARVPHRSTVEIATASGEAALDGTFGGVELRSASGGIVVTGEVDGDAQAKTVSGDVRLARVNGDVNVQSVSGEIDAESIGGSAAVKSVSGNVRLGSLREGDVKVQSVSGDVELGIASGTSIAIDAKSASGELASEVPLSDTPSGDADTKLVIRSNTVSGDVRVLRAA